MTDQLEDSPRFAIRASIDAVFLGQGERRLRATWRFLLAFGLFPVWEAVVGLVMGWLGLSGMVPGGFVQGLVFAPMLLVWAWAIDRRPLSDYGVSPSRRWLVDLLVAFLAVIGVWAARFGLTAWLGWLDLSLSMTAPQGTVLLGLAGTLASVAVNSLVQDLVFFPIVLASAAEGFHSRGLAPARAVVAGWLVASGFFAVVHGVPGPLDFAAHVVGGAVFGALYVHTGELALPLGVHWGSSWASGMVFASPAQTAQFPSVFEVTNALPGTTGLAVTLVLYPLTYLVLVGWLRWRRGEVAVDASLSRWTERAAGLPG